MTHPVILNFDQSAGSIADATLIDLTSWQDEVRYGCSMKTFRRLEDFLEKSMPSVYGSVLMGSGDFHHISALLVERICRRLVLSESLQLVILDNHPDNMRFPFGIHCGSWVSHVTRLKQIGHVHVLGITSGDIGLAHAWENRLGSLYTGKLTYWCMNVDVSWAQIVGLKNAFRYFDSPDELVAAFIDSQREQESPTYLSIDKDAFSEETVCTNWDQGCMSEQHLHQIIDALKSRLIGSDITGEVSNWEYQNKWKRCMSWLDGQKPVPKEQLLTWQKQQQNFNSRLLAALD